MLQTALITEVVAVRTEMDAAQHDFPVAQSLQFVELFNDDIRRDAAARTSGDRDHAEGATIVAAILDLEKSAGPGGVAGFEELQIVGVGGRRIEKTLGLGEFEQSVLFGIADDQIDANFDHLRRCELGVAAGDDDRRRGVGLFELADELAALSRSDGCHGAGVENAEVGWSARPDHPVSGLREAAGHGFDLADIEAAADGFETNLHHILLRVRQFISVREASSTLEEILDLLPDLGLFFFDVALVVDHVTILDDEHDRVVVDVAVVVELDDAGDAWKLLEAEGQDLANFDGAE